MYVYMYVCTGSLLPTDGYIGRHPKLQMARFTQLNERYEVQFGFPFILAVRNASKRMILNSLLSRVDNDRTTELRECIAQAPTPRARHATATRSFPVAVV